LKPTDSNSNTYYCQCGGDLESLLHTGNSDGNWKVFEANCFPVDATWDPVKKDYDKLPTQWNCSQNIMREPN
jgi:hypothetical protein